MEKKFQNNKQGGGIEQHKQELKETDEKSFWEKTKEFLSNKEILKQIGKTTIGSAASIVGVKSFYDVPAYVLQKLGVRKNKKEYKEILGDLGKEDISEEEMQNKKVGEVIKLENIEEMEDKIDKMGASEEIKNKLMQELNSLVENYHKERKTLEAGQNEKLTDILDEYIKTKISGVQAGREALNTFFVASGAYGLRGVSYGLMDGVDRYLRLKQQAENKGGKVDIIKDVIAGGIKETWQEARLKDAEGEEKTKMQKGLSAVRSWGKIVRYAGIGAMVKWHPETAGNSIDKALDALEGKVNLGDVVENYKGNIGRLAKFYGGIVKKPFNWYFGAEVEASEKGEIAKYAETNKRLGEMTPEEKAKHAESIQDKLKERRLKNITAVNQAEVETIKEPQLTEQVKAPESEIKAEVAEIVLEKFITDKHGYRWKLIMRASSTSRGGIYLTEKDGIEVFAVTNDGKNFVIDGSEDSLRGTPLADGTKFSIEETNSLTAETELKGEVEVPKISAEEEEGTRKIEQLLKDIGASQNQILIRESSRGNNSLSNEVIFLQKLKIFLADSEIAFNKAEISEGVKEEIIDNAKGEILYTREFINIRDMITQGKGIDLNEKHEQIISLNEKGKLEKIKVVEATEPLLEYTVEKNDNLWNIIGKMDDIKDLEGGRKSNAIANVIEAIKNDPEKFKALGFENADDIHDLEVGDEINLNKIQDIINTETIGKGKDTESIIKHAKGLDEQTVKSIEANDKFIADFHEARPDIPINERTTEWIIQNPNADLGQVIYDKNLGEIVTNRTVVEQSVKVAADIDQNKKSPELFIDELVTNNRLSQNLATKVLDLTNNGQNRPLFDFLTEKMDGAQLSTIIRNIPDKDQANIFNLIQQGKISFATIENNLRIAPIFAKINVENISNCDQIIKTMNIEMSDKNILLFGKILAGDNPEKSMQNLFGVQTGKIQADDGNHRMILELEKGGQKLFIDYKNQKIGIEPAETSKRSFRFKPFLDIRERYSQGSVFTRDLNEDGLKSTKEILGVKIKDAVEIEQTVPGIN